MKILYKVFRLRKSSLKKKKKKTALLLKINRIFPETQVLLKIYLYMESYLES